MRQPNNFLVIAVRTAFVFIISCSVVWADPGASNTKGLSKVKPESRPAIEVDGGFMVPYTDTIPGTDITIEMIPVPGGTYQMGSPEDEEGRQDDEGPQITIKVDPMWVGKTEVRWIEYKEFMRVHDTFVAMEAKDIRPVTDENRVDAVTAPTPLYDPSFTYEYGEDDDQPAVTMTQFAAKQFTKWLSKLVGRQYRLPTEAEWEWACRGGTDTAYSWGGVSDDFDDYAWCAENAEDGPAKVGLKKPNPLGLHDMHGNVAEWTVDGYLEDGYSIFKGKSLRAVDAIKSVETSDYRVVRGGSWESFPEDIRSASRLFSIDEDWKIEDPNFPKSPYWFTDDPTRGIGMRLFRSYKPLSTDNIKKFWEIDSEDTQFGVDARISEQKAIYGLVDPSLPDAKAALK